ncbi:MAG TPA: bacteriocin immunity protein [Gaiellaceae bacterium]
MTHAELVDLVRRIMAGEGDTEEEGDALVELFEANVPRPGASDLIFWPEHAIGEPRELTPEEVVDTALSYKPIPLGPASPPVDQS